MPSQLAAQPRCVGEAERHAPDGHVLFVDWDRYCGSILLRPGDQHGRVDRLDCEGGGGSSGGRVSARHTRAQTLRGLGLSWSQADQRCERTEVPFIVRSGHPLPLAHSTQHPAAAASPPATRLRVPHRRRPPPHVAAAAQ
jgi:hypothetical protein